MKGERTKESSIPDPVISNKYFIIAKEWEKRRGKNFIALNDSYRKMHKQYISRVCREYDRLETLLCNGSPSISPTRTISCTLPCIQHKILLCLFFINKIWYVYFKKEGTGSAMIIGFLIIGWIRG